MHELLRGLRAKSADVIEGWRRRRAARAKSCGDVDGDAAQRFTPKALATTLRILFVGFAILAGLLVLVGKLYHEQVTRHAMWLAKVNKGTDVTVCIPSLRGEIRDRNGLALARNRTSYAIAFYLGDMVRAYRAANEKVPQIEYVGTVSGMRKVLREPDVAQIVNETVVPRLEALGLAEDYNGESLQQHFRLKGKVPFLYLECIDHPSAAKAAANGTGVPGVEVVDRPRREYPLGALGAQLLGYVGALKDLDHEQDINDFTFYEANREGKAHLERGCDQWLRGTPGFRVLRRTAEGVIERELRRVEPKPGANVLLTIDARVQFIAERALRDAGVGRGAAVVVDPRNGDILAMASVPSFDPNVFIPAVPAHEWKELTGDDTDPLTNRALQSSAPGSIYKTVTALAGFRAGIPATRRFTCSGGVQYGSKYMKCWIAGHGTHGSLTLPDALRHSCNAFFYQWGNAAGIEQFVAVGRMLGLGEKSGIPLTGESGGVLPGPAWLRSVNPAERWSDGHTANVSIGQGYVLATPRQMAMVTAAIANGGTAFAPRLIHRVLDHEGTDARDPASGNLCAPHEAKIRGVLRKDPAAAAQHEAVREGMRRVVADGTGRRALIEGVSVAGKTGTAQFWRDDQKDNHAWFIAYAPCEAPRLALCVLVQGAKSGGGVAAPIAQRIMKQSLALDQGYDPGITALPPAAGSFAQIAAVDFEQPPGTIAAAAPDEEVPRAIAAASAPAQAIHL
jgi:penicillin-binding protein 2